MEKANADLHNHLKTGSYMPEWIFNKAVDIALQRLRKSGIFGMVNFEDRRYEDFVSLRGYERQDFGNAVYVPGKEILVVKGQEVPTKEGHLLVLGLTKDVRLKAGRTLDDTIKEARDNNGILVADHPFYLHGTGNFLDKHPEFLEQIDAIEIHNGEAIDLWPLTPIAPNERAWSSHIVWRNRIKSKGAERSLGALYVSDGHSLNELGTSYTILDMPDYAGLKTSGDVVSSLRKAVRADFLYGKKKDSISGALNHMIDLALIIAASKIGINIKRL